MSGPQIRSGARCAYPVRLTPDAAVTKLALAAEHGEAGGGLVEARAHSSERTGIDCTFPPRKWDSNLGRLVTIRQPNQRRKARGNSETAVQPATTAEWIAPAASQGFARTEQLESILYPAAHDLPTEMPIDLGEINFPRRGSITRGSIG